MVTAGVYLLVRTVVALPADARRAGRSWPGSAPSPRCSPPCSRACRRDIKRVLAYSTVSQLGYMMAAIGAGFAGAGFLHLLTHGVFKALLFLGAGAVIHAVGSNDIFAMGGLARRDAADRHRVPGRHAVARGHPALRAASSRRRRSWARCWAGGLTVPFAMLVLAAFLTAFYMFRVVFIAFFGAPGGRAGGPRRARRGARPRRAADHGAAALDPGRAVRWPSASGFAVSHPEAEFAAPGWLTPLAVGGRGRRHRARLARRTSAARSAPTGSPRRFAPDPRRPPLRALLARRPLRADLPRRAPRASRGCIGWVDRYLVDGVLNVLSAWTLTAGDRLRRIQTGQRAGLRLRGRARRPARSSSGSSWPR